MRAHRYCSKIFPLLLVSVPLMAAAQFLAQASAQPTAQTAAQTAERAGDPNVTGHGEYVRAEFPGRIAFGWAAPGVAAVISVPLPADVIPEEVTGVSLAEGVRLLGFSTEHDSRLLALYLSPAEGEVDVSFEEVGIELELGDVLRHRVGTVRIVLADAEPGPLAFERSLAAPGPGLYLAVALRNTSQAELLVGAVEYLPSELSQGPLLFSTGSDSAELLDALERAFRPAGRREGVPSNAAASGGVEGFDWSLAPDARLLVPPGETLILAWTADSLPDAAPITFLLQPVIEYSPVASDAPTYRLGLPVPLRAP